MPKFYVQRVETCQACRGTGRVRNILWLEFSRTFHGRPPSAPEERHFWLSRGHVYSPPPEEEPCPECGGKGEISDRVPLEEALAEIGGNHGQLE